MAYKGDVDASTSRRYARQSATIVPALELVETRAVRPIGRGFIVELGQRAIAEYRLDGKQLFFPNAGT